MQRQTDLVGLDMRTEPSTEVLCELVHLGAVAGEDGAVDDEGWSPEGVEVLALVLIDEVLFLWLAADMVGRAGLLGYQRVGLGMLLRTHDGRKGKGKERHDGRQWGVK